MEKKLIGVEIGATAYKILDFLRLHSDQFIEFEKLEARFGPATGSALWELRELGLVILAWESYDGYPPYAIAGAVLAEFGRSVSLPVRASGAGLPA